jgi:hypothetical protein
VLFAIPVATFGGVDRRSEVEVVADAHGMNCEFFNNKHSLSRYLSVSEFFLFKIHVLKYLKFPYAFLFLQSVLS